MKERFRVLYLRDADEYLGSLPLKARSKLMYNIGKSKYVNDPKLFKKLDGTDIWEFRAKYGGMEYRLLAFWDTESGALVVATHGFIKKSQKTPKNEIARALQLKSLYFQFKNNH